MEINRKINVLVTGIGAIIGYGIINSLKRENVNCNIYGMDIYNDAVGQYWCDEFIQSIKAYDEGYIDFLKNVIKEKTIDIVFFGTEQEMYVVSDNQCMFEDINCKFVINKKLLVDISKDKWETRKYLINNELGQFAIKSVIDGDYGEIKKQLGSKFLLKPRSSYASKGIVVVDNESDFNFYKKKMGSNFMAQEIVGDTENEYTVGVFGLGDDEIESIICMKRKLSQEGATAKAEVVFDEALEIATKTLCKKMKPLGPTNFQFRFHNGKYLLLEINPRISSSTSIRAFFGYNESKMSIDWFINKRKPQEVSVKKGKAIRYIDEVIIL